MEEPATMPPGTIPPLSISLLESAEFTFTESSTATGLSDRRPLFLGVELLLPLEVLLLLPSLLLGLQSKSEGIPIQGIPI
jgi:hypothetical protein